QRHTMRRTDFRAAPRTRDERAINDLRRVFRLNAAGFVPGGMAGANGLFGGGLLHGWFSEFNWRSRWRTWWAEPVRGSMGVTALRGASRRSQSSAQRSIGSDKSPSLRTPTSIFPV